MKFVVVGINHKEFVYNTFLKHSSKGYEVIAFVDRTIKNHEEQHDFFMSLPLWSFDTLLKNKSLYDGVFFSSIQTGFAEIDTTILFANNIWNVFIPYPIVIERQMDFLLNTEKGNFSQELVYPPVKNKPFIFRLETHVVDDCNLNCKGCNNFSSILKIRDDYSSESFKCDMVRVKKLFDNIVILGLQGGEPLINPEKSLSFAEIARQVFPKTDIRLLTNGLLVQKTDDSFFTSLRDLRITIHLSLYPPMKKSLDALVAKFKRIGVSYFIVGERSDFYKYLTLTPTQDKEWNNCYCGSTATHYINNGMMWKCPESALIKNLDATFGTAFFQSDKGINIYSQPSAEHIIEKLDSPCYLCSYCARQSRVYYSWDNNPDYQLSDWVIL